MSTFEWVDAHTVDEAVQLLSESTDQSRVIAKAGGMDVLDLIKEGLLQPTRVVNLCTIADLDEIRVDHNGLYLGASATLAAIAKDADVRARFSAVAESAAHAATPQVRNVATIAGNILQRPRDWYSRNELFAQADASVLSRQGANQYHSVFDNGQNTLVHASTPATALIAFEARVHLRGPQGERDVDLKDFLLPPNPARASDTAIDKGEVITHITAPAFPPGTLNAYHKQTERDSYDWPICDVAVVLTMAADRITRARIVMGWVAPTPKRAYAAEEWLVGRTLDDQTAAQAARLAVSGATPLSKNAYKVPVLETVVRRVLLRAAHP